jgi:DNA-binding CsgD family transcriptional regulator/extradiol dioxygenase family protein
MLRHAVAALARTELGVGKITSALIKLSPMSPRRGRGRPPHPDVLTPAEWQVLDWLRHGLTRGEIAARRQTSVDAVKYHLSNISGKLNVTGRALRHWPGIPATSGLSPRRLSMAANQPETIGRIGQISLSVRDVARAERFYGEVLGLPHLFTFGDLIFFDAGGVRLYLHRKDEADWQPGSVLYFIVDDIHAAQPLLSERGVEFSGAPHLIHTHDDGTEEWMSFFADGEGNTHALMARGQAARSPR